MLVRANSGGGQPNEVSLWNIGSTIPSTQSQTTANLLDSISNYDELKIVYRRSQSDDTSSFIKFPADKFNSTTLNRYVAGMTVSGIGVMCRYFQYSSDTAILISDCMQFNATNTKNQYIIITDIIGVKY